jgi:hypothetical protein
LKTTKLKTENNELGNAAWLLKMLPAIEPIKTRCEADYYGASSLIAKALGLDTVPESLASWSHGIAYWKDLKLARQLVLTATQLDRCLVCNKHQESFLRRKGYFRAHAVGAPILYVPEINVTRNKNSLLIMPTHSLYNTQHDWPFDAYAKYINTFRSEFKTIVACIHMNDVRKGHWPEAFEKMDIPWVRGADSSDGNAYNRMAVIFKSFEYMTTNATTGSHILYASYFGCKVSVAGPKAKYLPDDFRGVPWYDRNQKAMRYNHISMEKYLKCRRDPDFFLEPTEAGKNVEFAKKMLGLDCRRSPREVADLLGWNLAGQIELRVRKTLKRGITLPGKVGRKLWAILKNESASESPQLP